MDYKSADLFLAGKRICGALNDADLMISSEKRSTDTGSYVI